MWDVEGESCDEKGVDMSWQGWIVPGEYFQVFWTGQVETEISDFVEDKGDDGKVMGEEPYIKEPSAGERK